MTEPQDSQLGNKAFERNWSLYYQAVEGRPPRDTLLAALKLFESENTNRITPYFAVDLGCGDGRDTVELLRRGWRVLAIDGQQEAITRLLHRSDINPQLLETQVMRFENLTLSASVDLINSSFALPFCPPEHFPQLWNVIVSALRCGGRFAGQLFGERDSWAVYTSMNNHNRQQVEKLLQDFVIEVFDEESHPGKTALGEEKYWHIFHVVARKK